MSQNKISNINQYYPNIINNFPNNTNQNLNIYQNNYYQNQTNFKNYYNQNTNFKSQNPILYQKNSPEVLKTEYLQLKNLEHDNPKLIKENISEYEKQIILPIYIQINKSNILKKNFYIDLYNKYKNVIESIIIKKKIRSKISSSIWKYDE